VEFRRRAGNSGRQTLAAIDTARRHNALLKSPCASIIIEQKPSMPRAAIHPGERLAEELKELGLAAAEFARQIEVPVNRITGILNGHRGVTAGAALRLGHWFGASPQFWMNLQRLYELRRAEGALGQKLAKLPRREHFPHSPRERTAKAS
jgi:addiction module HigA family antidote